MLEVAVTYDWSPQLRFVVGSILVELSDDTPIAARVPICQTLFGSSQSLRPAAERLRREEVGGYGVIYPAQFPRTGAKDAISGPSEKGAFQPPALWAAAPRLTSLASEEITLRALTRCFGLISISEVNVCLNGSSYVACVLPSS